MKKAEYPVRSKTQNKIQSNNNDDDDDTAVVQEQQCRFTPMREKVISCKDS